MREDLLEKCERFIRNAEVMKASFGWNSGLINMCGAASVTFDGIEINIIRLKQISELYKRMTGSSSYFSSMFKPILCSTVYLAYDPGIMLKKITDIYRMFNVVFHGSQFLPQASAIIAQAGNPNYYKWLTERTKAIYERVKVFHPFITNYADVIYCSMLALSTKSDDEIIDDVNICSRMLRSMSFSPNVLQSVSFILALCDGSTEFRAQQISSLYSELKKIKCKFGSKYELAALAALSSSQRPAEEIAIDISDADNWLSQQRFFNFFSMLSKSQRRLFAGMLSFDTNIPNTALKAANNPASFFIKQACICSLISTITTGRTY